VTLHVYVETLLAEVGPVVEVQVVIPETPVIAQVPLPVGALALFGPVTVAVKVIVDPRALVAEFAVTETVGVVLLTVVVPPEVSAEAK
jgi:hypothetical protein